MDIRYEGNGAYCYSNTTSMLLSSIGENIPPSLIEVLGGIGLGAFTLPERNICFFSNFSGLPDQAISKSLKILGFEFTEEAFKNPKDFLSEKLASILENGPAILGPLDMGYLAYDPKASNHHGVDHFILALAADKGTLCLHDPAGFPYALLNFENLKQAWQADKIEYKRYYYRYWTAPKRIKSPTEDEIYEKALEHFKNVYKTGIEYGKKKNILVDVDAILFLADNVASGKLGKQDIETLSSFVFQLGARRALDYARFFQKRNSKLSNLKNGQAKLFGLLHTRTVENDWKEVDKLLKDFAKTESEFKRLILD